MRCRTVYPAWFSPAGTTRTVVERVSADEIRQGMGDLHDSSSLPYIWGTPRKTGAFLGVWP